MNWTASHQLTLRVQFVRCAQRCVLCALTIKTNIRKWWAKAVLVHSLQKKAALRCGIDALIACDGVKIKSTGLIRQFQFNVGWHLFNASHNCISGHADVVEVLHFSRAHYFGDFAEAVFYEVSIGKRLVLSYDELGDLIVIVAFPGVWGRKKILFLNLQDSYHLLYILLLLSTRVGPRAARRAQQMDAHAWCLVSKWCPTLYCFITATVSVQIKNKHFPLNSLKKYWLSHRVWNFLQSLSSFRVFVSAMLSNFGYISSLIVLLVEQLPWSTVGPPGVKSEKCNTIKQKLKCGPNSILFIKFLVGQLKMDGPRAVGWTPLSWAKYLEASLKAAPL